MTFRIMQSLVMLSVVYKPLMLSVVMLTVVAPTRLVKVDESCGQSYEYIFY
jgi:hypothetical protein